MKPREANSLEQQHSDPPVYSVPEFCRAHCIARSYLYLLMREGRGPRVMKLGRRTLITREAATEWRNRIEQATENGQ